jgi:hypothetical protein
MIPELRRAIIAATAVLGVIGVGAALGYYWLLENLRKPEAEMWPLIQAFEKLQPVDLVAAGVNVPVDGEHTPLSPSEIRKLLRAAGVNTPYPLASNSFGFPHVVSVKRAVSPIPTVGEVYWLVITDVGEDGRLGTDDDAYGDAAITQKRN